MGLPAAQPPPSPLKPPALLSPLTPLFCSLPTSGPCLCLCCLSLFHGRTLWALPSTATSLLLGSHCLDGSPPPLLTLPAPTLATDTSSPLLQAPLSPCLQPPSPAELDHLSWRRINSSWMATNNGNVNHYSEKKWASKDSRTSGLI